MTTYLAKIIGASIIEAIKAKLNSGIEAKREVENISFPLYSSSCSNGGFLFCPTVNKYIGFLSSTAEHYEHYPV
jgi:hypothetical protein